ncbi:hypothetical protein RFI_26548 [Reticulomyxa filosa]|uniref:Uncharacterized protein n=1 Tax=Reticulomyxa filosa TaxID=46433 RepID=X6MAC2_RETFI|nr:hypothetical protein RFI_26548 [Reticulomyxa filosa]|eukprot:ETO10829.1 hypothetical protein RFI_26548 [Reticulomyxa filosa]
MIQLAVDLKILPEWLVSASCSIQGGYHREFLVNGIDVLFLVVLSQILNMASNESESWCWLHKFVHWHLKINLQFTTEDGRDDVLYFKVYILVLSCFLAVVICRNQNNMDMDFFYYVVEAEEWIKEGEKKKKEEKVPINSIGNMASGNESRKKCEFI